MNVKAILDSGRVLRYHSTMVEKKQSIDQHSWEVAIILKKIYPIASGDLLFYALTHDCAEACTGDIPAPFKRKYPKLRMAVKEAELEYTKDVLKISHPTFTEEEEIAVKFADILSGIYHTYNRIKKGDSDARPVLDTWIEYYDELFKSSMPSFEINKQAQKVLEEVMK